MAKPLNNEQLNSALEGLKGWDIDDNSITRTYLFSSFTKAVAFLVQISFIAEDANHHPELWNVYNRVRISLSTHDAGNRVTAKDVALAEKIEKVFLNDD